MSGIVPAVQQDWQQNEPLVDKDGRATQYGGFFFLALWQRSGESKGTPSTGEVTAAGTAAADATDLPYIVNLVTTAAGATGVKLIITQPGDQQLVFNDTATAAQVYPPDGSTLDGGTTAYSVTNGGAQIFTVVAEGDIRSLQLV